MTIREAASQFEALLIGQMLKEMRTSEAGGWLGGGEEASGGTIIELAEEQLARALTIQGGLGLGRLIADQFKAEASVAASTGNQVPVKPETGV
jgi:Rod binding domain-containing protein